MGEGTKKNNVFSVTSMNFGNKKKKDSRTSPRITLSFGEMITKTLHSTSDPVMEMYLAAVSREGKETEKTRELCRQTPIKIVNEP